MFDARFAPSICSPSLLRKANGRVACLPVEMRDVTFNVGGKRLIDGLSLRLTAGSRTVMLGLNGAGKSLTLRLLHGLLPPSSGEIRWANCERPWPEAGRVAFVPQRPVLLRRSVAGNLKHALAVGKIPRAEHAERLDKLLEVGGLHHRRGHPARALSGGEQQRLAIVRALAANPEILLLDEPTTSLDPQSVLAIEDLIAKAHLGGVKVVVVTHDLQQARRLADEVVFIHRGRVSEHTDADRFFVAPQSQAARLYADGRCFL